MYTCTVVLTAVAAAEQRPQAFAPDPKGPRCHAGSKDLGLLHWPPHSGRYEGAMSVPARKKSRCAYWQDGARPFTGDRRNGQQGLAFGDLVESNIIHARKSNCDVMRALGLNSLGEAGGKPRVPPSRLALSPIE